MNEPKQTPPLSEQAKALKMGIYQHFRGMRYEVLGVSRHSETLEEFVVYRALYGTYDLWIRPLAMFCEEVSDAKGIKVARFRPLDQ